MNPPSNSKIILATDQQGFALITLPRTSSWTRYPLAAFLIFWLGGWLMGLVGVGGQLLHPSNKDPVAFLLFWLGGWAIGGCFVIFMLYRIIRPPIAESLLLAKPELVYDSGLPTFDFMPFYYRQRRRNVWKKVFQKRRFLRFSPTEVATLKLRDIEGDNRLTIDYQNERIDLGENLTEIEREWLYSELKGEYHL